MVAIGGADAVNAAAAFNHVDCLQYLQHIGCPVTAAASLVAVRSGSIACMKYLHTVGCPWDAFTLQAQSVELAQRPVEIAFDINTVELVPESCNLSACFCMQRSTAVKLHICRTLSLRSTGCVTASSICRAAVLDWIG